MEEKVKFEIEFPIQASPSLLYQYMSSPSGMSEWFADNVNSRGEYYTFIWNGSEEKAKLLGKKREFENKLSYYHKNKKFIPYEFYKAFSNIAYETRQERNYITKYE